MDRNVGGGPRPKRRVTRAVEVLIVSLLGVTIVVILSVPFFASPTRGPVSTVQGTVEVTWEGGDSQPSAGMAEPGWVTFQGGSLDEEVLPELSASMGIVLDDPAGAAGLEETQGGWSAVHNEVRALRPVMQRCYEISLGAREPVEADLVVHFALATDGAVGEMELDTTSALDEGALGACVRASLSSVSFGGCPAGRYSVPVRFVAP